MHATLNLLGRQFQFGYDAVKSTKKRTTPPTTQKSEDDILNRSDRRTLVATAADANRNFSLVAWMVRNHVDYVARFGFQARTSSKRLNARIESLMKWWMRPENSDAARRHHFLDQIPLLENMRVLQGDSGLLKLRAGQVQGIEGERVRKPTMGRLPGNLDTTVSDHGLLLDNLGAVEKYVICKRNGTDLVYDKVANAEDMAWCGYFTRFDQTRGVSPLASALNSLADLYEGFDYTLIKMKVHALFGVAIMRQAQQANGSDFRNLDYDDGAAPDTSTVRYKYELKPGLKLELQPGDDIKTIESHTPSDEWLQASQYLAQIAMLALDIPYTFFDARASSFSAAGADVNRYVKSVEGKQRGLTAVLQNVTEWKLRQWITAGLIDQSLLGNRKLTDIAYEWRPRGAPWIEREAQVKADMALIGIGAKSHNQVCLEHGNDYFENIDEIAIERAYAKKKGVPLIEALPGQTTTEDAQPATPNGSNDNAE